MRRVDDGRRLHGRRGPRGRRPDACAPWSSAPTDATSTTRPARRTSSPPCGATRRRARLTPVPDDPLTIGDDGCVGDGDPSATSAGVGRLRRGARAARPDRAGHLAGRRARVRRQLDAGRDLDPAAQPHDRRADARSRTRPARRTPRGLPRQPATDDANVCVQLARRPRARRPGRDRRLPRRPLPLRRRLGRGLRRDRASSAARRAPGRSRPSGRIPRLGDDPRLHRRRRAAAVPAGRATCMANPSARWPSRPTAASSTRREPTASPAASPRTPATRRAARSRCRRTSRAASRTTTARSSSRAARRPATSRTPSRWRWRPTATSLYAWSRRQHRQQRQGGRRRHARSTWSAPASSPASTPPPAASAATARPHMTAVPTCQQGIGLHTPTSVAV